VRAERTIATTIDEYIAAYPPDIQEILQTIRETIREAAPGATEAVKYGLATFVLEGNLVHFGAFQHHVGFYPAPSGLDAFEDALAPYARSKGAVRFPLGRPIPYDLIRAITEFRVRENLAKAKTSRKKRRPA